MEKIFRSVWFHLWIEGYVADKETRRQRSPQTQATNSQGGLTMSEELLQVVIEIAIIILRVFAAGLAD